MRALKTAAKIVAWLLLVVYFVYLRFPYDRVRPRLEEELANLGGLQLSFGSLGPDGRGGLRLGDVTLRPGSATGLASGAAAGPTYHLERLDARPHLLSLLRGRAGARIHAEGYDGSLSGTVSRASETELRIDLDVDDVELTGMPMPNGGALQGRLDASIDDLVVVPGQALQGLNGHLELEATKGAVLPFQTRTTRIPPQPVQFDRLAASADVEAGQLRVETLEVEGSDVSASGHAEITLSRNLGRSPVTGELRVKFGPDFSVYEDVVKGLTRARTDSEGYLTLNLKGTLARPM